MMNSFQISQDLMCRFLRTWTMAVIWSGKFKLMLLPDDPILHILSYLSYKDLIKYVTLLPLVPFILFLTQLTHPFCCIIKPIYLSQYVLNFLYSCSNCCQRLHDLCNHDLLWKKQCRTIWDKNEWVSPMIMSLSSLCSALWGSQWCLFFLHSNSNFSLLPQHMRPTFRSSLTRLLLLSDVSMDSIGESHSFTTTETLANM